jgi:hypothetical protein
MAARRAQFWKRAMTAIGKERELRPHWQQVHELMLQEADVAAVSWRVRLAVLKDA